MHGLCQHGAPAAAQRRPWIDLDLPTYAVAAGRLQLPASADMFGLWRRGDRTFRIVGRRLDDFGSDLTLSALGDFRHRQRAADETAERPVVSAVALWTLAQRQRLFNSHCCHAGNFSSARRLVCCSDGRKQTMRWKISHHGHDPRQIDLLAILALLIVIVTAWHYFESGPKPQTTTAFIEPSQSVRW